MNIFRLLGDMLHVVAIELLLVRIWNTQSCAGISGKSQILLLLVSLTRYLDLVTNFVSLYNTFLKLLFIGTGTITVYLIYRKFWVSLAVLEIFIKSNIQFYLIFRPNMRPITTSSEWSSCSYPA